MYEYPYIFSLIILGYSYIVKPIFSPYNIYNNMPFTMYHHPVIAHKIIIHRKKVKTILHAESHTKNKQHLSSQMLSSTQEGYIVISYAPLFRTMKEKHITSYRLEKMGFSRATYYSIQRGNSVSTNTINQLCRLLKCNVTDIMEYIDDEETDFPQ